MFPLVCLLQITQLNRPEHRGAGGQEKPSVDASVQFNSLQEIQLNVFYLLERSGSGAMSDSCMSGLISCFFYQQQG